MCVITKEHVKDILFVISYRLKLFCFVHLRNQSNYKMCFVPLFLGGDGWSLKYYLIYVMYYRKFLFSPWNSSFCTR